MLKPPEICESRSAARLPVDWEFPLFSSGCVPQDADLTSPTRDSIRAPCSESAESYPLDHKLRKKSGKKESGPRPTVLIGLGPHSSKKKQDLDKLYELKSKARQIMNQFGPSALINLSNFSSIKPEPASTPPQGSMANSTAVVKIPGTPGTGGRLSPENNQVLTKKKLQDLVREVDPNEQLDEDVEEMLLQIADDFIESVVTAACQLARHRKSSTLEVKDVQLHLERQWNMWIPGFGSEEIRPYKKACTTEAHKQRMALIRKTTKK
ncbi:hypothetical protein AB1E18_000999 [Capra hircus]